MAEDIKLIKKYNLEAVKKRLDEMNAYNGFIVTEAAGDPNDQNNNDPMADPMQAGQQGDQMPGGDPMAAQGQGIPQQDPMGNPAQAGQMGGNDPMGGQNPMVDPSQAGGIPKEPAGEEPVEGDGSEDDGLDADVDGEDGDEVETDEMEEGDEVIDVDDLTTSQEETERELGDVNKNMVTLLKVVKKCIQAISDNDKKLEDLMAEYERRNPTEDEKTNVRVKQGAPFTGDTNSFWSERGQRMYDDNMVDPRHDTEYIITLDDVKDSNMKEVADSISKFPNKLTDFLKF